MRMTLMWGAEKAAPCRFHLTHSYPADWYHIPRAVVLLTQMIESWDGSFSTPKLLTPIAALVIESK